MRLVVLLAITMRSFRCFEQEVTIEFPTNGFVFLSGKNEVEPRMGANGVGKSSLIDALAWCLYGTSIRGERASDLASWGLKQRPYVAVVYSIGEEIQIIERTGSPDTLTINEQPVPQSAVDSLMGLSRIRFTQSVIFGQSAKLFMDLSVPERGALMDEVMDLGIWLKRADFAVTKSNELLKGIAELNKTLALETGRMESGLVRLEELEALERQWQATHSAALSAARSAYSAADGELRTAEQTARKIEQELPSAEQEQGLTDEVRGLELLITNITIEHTRASDQVKFNLQDQFFLRDNKVCPTCQQTINAAFAHHKHTELEASAVGLTATVEELESDKNTAAELLQEAQEELRGFAYRRRTLGGQLASARTNVRAKQQALVQARQALDNVTKGTEENPTAARIVAVKQELETLAETIDEIEHAIAGASADQTKNEYWGKRGFRQVRLFLLQRVLTMMEIETAAAAASLGVGTWQIKFTVESETRSPGIHINAINPQERGKYSSYSFGEAQRVKLAVSMGLAALIQSMSGVWHNILVLDEPTAHLSVEGIDDLLECLEANTASTGKTVWLADHRSTDYPFDSIYQVTKRIGGSTIDKIR